MSIKILLVDDDVSLTKTIERTLQAAGYKPLIAYTAEDGLQKALTHRPDLILLDIMVPASGGWEVCRRVREQSNVPIIFLTALGNTENIVYGLEVGADDYIVKPFEDAELLARIKAHLRRMKNDAARFAFGDDEIVIDVQARLVSVRGEEIELTPREYDLLIALASNAGRVIPTAELVDRAWGMTDQAATENAKPYIHYLRKKIELDPAAPHWILTVRGVGYRFAEG
ncbi:MAG: response regulator transcription factor [Anaerolineales bacterium]|nr:response regulator transcription factor [Anaerolineales bacterium]MCB8992000.1 response regulator transcription factor [Ardenticatenaceae bacterium]MCB9004602.1 response regulator transcription factor [Ardenticatenaceae bacterium]